MKIAIYARTAAKRSDPRFKAVLDSLGRHTIYDVFSEEELQDGTDMLLSLGGDGTFLCASTMACRRGIPVLGVNLGRMGFLSEYTPEEVVEAIKAGEYVIEERQMLRSDVDGRDERYSLNEVSVNRIGSAMLGVEVSLDGDALPTYWADGLLVATSSGSTAYSLSAGGPICTPDARVLLITPIAPHNLNVRPLVVPSDAHVEISFRSRDADVMLTRDNAHTVLSSASRVSVSVAQFSLKRVRLTKSNFIGALRSKLFWGEDVRNTEL